MDFILERQIVEYSIRVFNYFNGKVNQYIPAKLNIRTNFNKNVLGNNMFNNVNLYLWNIINYYNHDINEIKTNIIINIVHELCHIEQELDYIRYNIDNDYRQQKENENNFRTYKFIYKNIDQISNDLGVRFDIEYIYDNYVYYSKYETNYMFSFEDYYKRCIKTIIHNDINDNAKEYIDNVIDEYENVVFELNGVKILLKYNGEVISNTTIFNKAIENYNNTNRSSSETEIYIEYGFACISTKLYLSYTFNIG